MVTQYSLPYFLFARVGSQLERDRKTYPKGSFPSPAETTFGKKNRGTKLRNSQVNKPRFSISCDRFMLCPKNSIMDYVSVGKLTTL